MKSYIDKMRVLVKMVKSASLRVLAEKLSSRNKKRLRKLLLKSTNTWLVIIDKVVGLKKGNEFFWKTWLSNSWVQVDHRLRYIHDKNPDQVEYFVNVGYDNATNQETIVNLARSRLSKNTIRNRLLNEKWDSTSSVLQRSVLSEMTCAGFVMAVTLLLDDKLSKAITERLSKSNKKFSKNFKRLIDTSGVSIAKKKEEESFRGSLPHSGFKTPKKHRLIVARSLSDVPTVPLLFDGAEEVTLFIMNDLYGRTDFTDQMPHYAASRVNIEHCRTRITRFSAEYHRIHEDTREVAEQLIKALNDECGKELPLEDLSGAELALADNIFFACLQFVALERLLKSDEFDHIVVAFGGAIDIHPALNKRFAYLLSGVEGLAKDPRLETVCLSPCQKALDSFEIITKILLVKPSVPASANTKPHDFSATMKILQSKSELLIGEFGEWSGSELPKVILATSQVSAYNKSSAEYSKALSKIANLRIAFVGGNLLDFFEKVKGYLKLDDLWTFPVRKITETNDFHKWLINFIRQKATETPHKYVSHVIASNISSVTSDGILSFMTHSHYCDALFAKLKEKDQLPEAVVLTPFRSIRVLAFASVAQRYNVPSIAVEPHGLNASYCRYCKITADYYGVISKFFSHEALDGFGMSLKRSPAIGSPRLKGPGSEYDITAAKRNARTELSKQNKTDLNIDRPIVSYFAQPSDWNQISEVWRIILEATNELNCFLFLKTHPEEGSHRVESYLEIAAEMNALHRVKLIEGDAIKVIEASDLVLSGYSATVVEAALYRRPVFCVTNGDVDYPLNQHDIIGGPLFRNVTDLRNEISAFLSDPAPYYSSVADFLDREPPLIEGFEKHFQDLVKEIIAMPRDESIRPHHERPASLFLDAPHIVYKV